MILRQLQSNEIYKVSIEITLEYWNETEGSVSKTNTIRNDTYYTKDINTVLDIDIDIRDFETYEAHSMEQNRFEYSNIKNGKLFNYTVFIWIMQECDDIFL